MVDFGKLLDLVELGESVVHIRRIGGIGRICSGIGNIGEGTIGNLEWQQKLYKILAEMSKKF